MGKIYEKTSEKQTKAHKEFTEKLLNENVNFIYSSQGIRDYHNL